MKTIAKKNPLALDLETLRDLTVAETVKVNGGRKHAGGKVSSVMPGGEKMSSVMPPAHRR